MISSLQTPLPSAQEHAGNIRRPVIVSASRATDIPAFFARWFAERLRKGYVHRRNPFNHVTEVVSFEDTRVIVFWSKNPRPLIPYLTELEARNIHYYFQFTVNDYERENLEPHVPPLAERIDTFRALSGRVGRKRVVWRFDPLLLTDDLTVDRLVERVAAVAEQLRAFTEKLVISFADIAGYARVRNNLSRAKVSYREFTPGLMIAVAERLHALNRRWGLRIATCAEGVDLEPYGIEHNRCVDDRLIMDQFGHDQKLMRFLGCEPDFLSGPTRPCRKDRGQRKECRCIVSKDIGMYDTCSHLCAYCYANTSLKAVANNLAKHRDDADALVS